MQANQQIQGGVGFQTIPTRIRDLPPLIVEPEQTPSPEITTEFNGQLDALTHGLAQTHRAAAEALLSQRRYDEALAHLEAAARFAPDELEYHNQLGFVRYLQGDDHGAVASFERVLGVQPNNADALFNLGMVLYGREEFATAEDCFRRSLDTFPNDAETWNNRGVCLHQLGRIDDARICFTRALQIEPANEDAKANLTAMGA